MRPFFPPMVKLLAFTYYYRVAKNQFLISGAVSSKLPGPRENEIVTENMFPRSASPSSVLYCPSSVVGIRLSTCLPVDRYTGFAPLSALLTIIVSFKTEIVNRLVFSWFWLLSHEERSRVVISKNIIRCIMSYLRRIRIQIVFLFSSYGTTNFQKSQVSSWSIEHGIGSNSVRSKENTKYEIQNTKYQAPTGFWVAKMI